MRKILGNLGSDERHTFRAKFGKYGYKRYHDASRGDLYSATMVVRNVEIIDNPAEPKMITDHLWLNLTKGFASLGLLKEGDVIQFNGRVSAYTKGFITKDKMDYELTYPSKIQLVTKRETQPLPTDHQVQIGMIMNLNYKFYANSGRPLVPYFMDAFAKWQKEQVQPLPIKVHRGNAYENDSKYEALDYQKEKTSLEKSLQERQKKQAARQKEGLAFLKKQPSLTKDLVTLARKAKKQAQNNADPAASKYCYISSSKLAKVLDQYHLDKDKEPAIKQALASDWFHQQVGADEFLSPLQQLANKFNQH